MENKAQAEEKMKKISPDICLEFLSGVENISELCKRKKKSKKMHSSSRGSDATPVVGPVSAAEFLNASIQGRLNVIDRYLTDGGNPDVHDELQRTALHVASMEGHCAVVQMLLERGADIDFKDRLGSRAIHWACRGGNLAEVKVLMSHGADVNARDKLYSTPLHVATRTGRTVIVEYLLSSGAKINSRDREGDTPLHDAVRLNRYKIVKMLILAGADTKMQNLEGLTAVQQVKQWQFDIIETLQRLEKQREVGLEPSERNPERTLISSS